MAFCVVVNGVRGKHSTNICLMVIPMYKESFFYVANRTIYNGTYRGCYVHGLSQICQERRAKLPFLNKTRAGAEVKPHRRVEFVITCWPVGPVARVRDGDR
jgi:hypothetical protein